MLKNILKSIIANKKIIFIYIPLIILFLIILYTGIIYLSWLGDKEQALNRLSKYKKLIDRTEELREGYQYSYSTIDITAKVVDIPTRIYDRNSEVIGEFFEQKREIVPYSNIPQWLINAVIASEDRSFYTHHGISYQGILRAFLVNLSRLKVVQGGSTITQQLAKVLFTDMERNFKRKIYEAFCAVEIEDKYDKQDILSMYLNLIYFGNGAYGVESASKMFFGVSVNGLNETECAMIAATICNPSIYSPLAGLQNSLRKTRIIMRSMIDAGFMKEETAAYQLKQFLKKWDFSLDQNAEPVSSLIGSFLYSSYKVNRAPTFIEGIRRVLVDKFGEDVVKKGGLSVYTTIDAAKQDIAMAVMKKGILDQKDFHHKISEKNITSIQAAQEEEKAKNIEGALIAINPFTGEIISYVGGYAFSTKSQLDHVTQILRQPGSSFKPVIYTAAIENKSITPSSIFIDEKTTFETDYSPENYTNNYQGKIIVREALKRSINVVAVKILEETGYDTIFPMIEKSLDLTEDEVNRRFGKTLSLALGTYEISPLENCILHSTIVNGGNFVLPYGIRFVKDYNSNIIWDNQKEVCEKIEEKRRVYEKIIDPIACSIIVSMLKGIFESGGTGYSAVHNKGIKFPIAGKTGTSANFNDAWFAGYTSDLVTVIWIGNNAGAISLGNGRSGGVVAAPIWAEYISTIYPPGGEPGDFYIPEEGITKQTICLDSGMVPRKNNLCPRVEKDQLFYAGTEPGEFCNIHIDK